MTDHRFTNNASASLPAPADDFVANPRAVWIGLACFAGAAATIADIIADIDPHAAQLLRSLADDTIDTDDLKRLWRPAAPAPPPKPFNNWGRVS